MTGDWSGDGTPDILARTQDGRLLMYRGNGSGGFSTGQGEQVGSGWRLHRAAAAARLGRRRQADILARDRDSLLLYRGNGAGGSSRAGRASSAAAGRASRLLAPGDSATAATYSPAAPTAR